MLRVSPTASHSLHDLNELHEQCSVEFEKVCRISRVRLDCMLIIEKNEDKNKMENRRKEKVILRADLKDVWLRPEKGYYGNAKD